MHHFWVINRAMPHSRENPTRRAKVCREIFLDYRSFGGQRPAWDRGKCRSVQVRGVICHLTVAACHPDRVKATASSGDRTDRKSKKGAGATSDAPAPHDEEEDGVRIANIGRASAAELLGDPIDGPSSSIEPIHPGDTSSSTHPRPYRHNVRGPLPIARKPMTR